jgi:hypothetical protein
MSRISFIEYKGKKLLMEDFSHAAAPEELIAWIDEARKVIASQPEKSVLAVLDATGSRFNNDVLEAMKQFTKANAPYVNHACVVGIDGLLAVALTAVSKFSGRSFKTCANMQEAKDWLVSQP